MIQHAETAMPKLTIRDAGRTIRELISGRKCIDAVVGFGFLYARKGDGHEWCQAISRFREGVRWRLSGRHARVGPVSDALGASDHGSL